MTLDEFRAWARPRCKEVPHMGDDMPCLVWQGATVNKGHPRACIGGRSQQVRRVAWESLNPDKLLGPDSARPACDCGLCIEPTHMERVTQADYRKVPKSLAGRLNMQAASRRSRSKVKNPQEVVPLVLADNRPAHVLAKELGLGEDVIRDMRKGKWNAAAFGQGNPFALLMIG